MGAELPVVSGTRKKSLAREGGITETAGKAPLEGVSSPRRCIRLLEQAKKNPFSRFHRRWVRQPTHTVCQPASKSGVKTEDVRASVLMIVHTRAV